jgi:peptide/nickel transport system substrate-binding protein
MAVAVLGLIGSACGQPPPGGGATTTPAGTVAATSSPTRGGTFIFAMWQEPTTLAPHHANQTIAGLVLSVAVEGLGTTDNDGNPQPRLAKSIPTIENSGVNISSDGKKMSVKWELQPGLKWSDGQAVTSQDIVFTWQTWMKDPKSVSRAGFSEIESIDTPNELTAVVNYKSIYAAYVGNFNDGLIPKHLLQSEADISKTDYIRRPLGTGPFKITEFKAGESITAERNPNYRVKDKPYLDKVIFKSVPSSQVAIAQLKAGEIHGMWNLVESEAADVEKDASVKIVYSPSNSTERIEFNLAAKANPADPKVPHPFLGDVRVRRALIHATPKQAINDKLLFGKAKMGQSVNPQGWAADSSITQESYDQKKANELLDQAGWVKGADGIRSKGGVRASLVINTTTGNQLRERVQQVIVDEWKQVGVELKIENMPSAVLLSGSWDNDPRQRGNYDMALYTTTPASDPQTHMSQRYHSRQIPTDANRSGQNRMRLSDAELDKMIDDAGSTVDRTKRKDLYGKIFRKINELAPAIWLYARQNIDAHGPRAGGWKPHAWDEVVWNIEDWFLKSQ